MTFIRFYLYLIAITLLQVGIVLSIPQLIPVNDVIKAIVFFAILTAAIFPIANMGAGNKDGYTFITTAYIAIGLRFILSMCYVVYYKLTRTTYENGFIFSFFISYIFYTVFEITSLTAKLRPNLKGKTSSDESVNN
ncbi:MAG: hypothetical protein V4658_11975 [Bacteroidota bacterium]